MEAAYDAVLSHPDARRGPGLMPSFANPEALAASLSAAGLEALTERIAATCKPCLRFRRVQVPEDDDTVLASRVGGLPALPADMAWPMRPALPDAAAQAQALETSHAFTMDQMSVEGWAKSLEAMKSFLPQDDLDAMAYPYSPQMIADVEAAYEAERAALFVPMPLAFIAQINLGALSQSAGFDPALPPSGLMLFFEDVTQYGHPGQIVYLPDLDGLTARPIPEALSQYARAQQGVQPCRAQAQMCERLEPVTALSVPCHWISQSDAVQDWFCDAAHVLTLESAETAGDFGDQLGGWPEDVQDHPEFDMEPHDPPQLFEPGQTPWRMLFSYGGEVFDGTRIVTAGGDGQTYWMLHEAQLAAHDWSKARALYQQT